MTQRFSYQAVVGAGYAVDTFYMIRYSNHSVLRRALSSVSIL